MLNRSNIETSFTDGNQQMKAARTGMWAAFRCPHSEADERMQPLLRVGCNYDLVDEVLGYQELRARLRDANSNVAGIRVPAEEVGVLGRDNNRPPFAGRERVVRG
jgi:hypothetical protein